MNLPGGHQHNVPDHTLFTREHAEADRAQRMRDRGHSHWIEAVIAGVVGVAVLAWVAWAIVF